MQVVALCEHEGCTHLFTFDLDGLIEGVGPEFPLAEIPPMACPRCGVAPLLIRLSFADPPPAEED